MTVKTIIIKAYVLAIMAVMVWGPLIALHGYRQWWAVTFYAAAGGATIGGIISHHRASGKRRRHATRSRLAELAVAFLSVAVIVFAVYWAFQLTRQAGIPPAAGAARLLVTGSPFNTSDRLQLGLVTNHPETRYVEYNVVVGCNTKAKNALLMLSGNAQLPHPSLFGVSSVTEGTAYVGEPWFSSSQAVQLFEIQLKPMPCPVGVSTGQLGTVISLEGFVRNSFETAAGSSHALQLPLVGDETNHDTYIPALGGFWASPVGLIVSVHAGGLPLNDRIDVVRPALTGSGDLSWTGPSFIRPSATWTDLASASRGQILVLVLGAVIGTFGSALAVVAIDWIRALIEKDGEEAGHSDQAC